MSDQPQDVQVILKRIDILEKQNRWFIRAGLVASLLAIAAVTMGQARTSRTVEAEQFILRDAQGRQRLTIGTPRFSGVAIGLEANGPAIWITGSNGVDRAILTSDGIYWADEHGKGTARIEGVDNRGSGPTIEFLDPKGGKDALFFSAGRLEMNAKSDLSVGLTRKDLEELGGTFGPNIFLDDENGDTRVNLGLRRNRPSLVIKDAQGFYAQLGSADLVTTRTGEERQTSAASLVLYGKDGKVIWSAP